MKISRTRCIAMALSLLGTVIVIPYGIGAEVIAVDRHLVKYATGVVYDFRSGLEWFAGPDRGMAWQDAKAWVAALDAHGGSWRMPDRKELDTLYSVGDGVNTITYLLYNTGYWVWAGQTRDAAYAWIFSFSYGGEGWNGQPPLDGGRAVAVRNSRHP
jgi:hypothetical protein